MFFLIYLSSRRKIDEHGHHVKVGGTKAELGGRIKDFDRSFFGRRLRILNRLDIEFLEAACRRNPLLDPNQIVKQFDGDHPPITRGMISSLVESEAVPPVLFNTSLRLMRERETLVGVSYLESNRIPRPMPDLICSMDVMDICLEGDFAGAKRILPNDYQLCSRIFLPVLKDDVYRLVYIDLRKPLKKSIEYFDPRINSSLPLAQIQLPANFDADKAELRRCAYYLLLELGLCEIGEAWTDTINTFPKYVEGVQYFEVLSAAHLNDSGVYVLSAIDFISNDVPCIFFRENMKHLRSLLAHQILVGNFPI